jgi:hypothetical protein
MVRGMSESECPGGCSSSRTQKYRTGEGASTCMKVREIKSCVHSLAVKYLCDAVLLRNARGRSHVSLLLPHSRRFPDSDNGLGTVRSSCRFMHTLCSAELACGAERKLARSRGLRRRRQTTSRAVAISAGNNACVHHLALRIGAARQ